MDRVRPFEAAGVTLASPLRTKGEKTRAQRSVAEHHARRTLTAIAEAERAKLKEARRLASITTKRCKDANKAARELLAAYDACCADSGAVAFVPPVEVVDRLRKALK